MPYARMLRTWRSPDGNVTLAEDTQVWVPWPSSENMTTIQVQVGDVTARVPFEYVRIIDVVVGPALVTSEVTSGGRTFQVDDHVMVHSLWDTEALVSFEGRPSIVPIHVLTNLLLYRSDAYHWESRVGWGRTTNDSVLPTGTWVRAWYEGNAGLVQASFVSSGLAFNATLRLDGVRMVESIGFGRDAVFGDVAILESTDTGMMLVAGHLPVTSLGEQTSPSLRIDTRESSLIEVEIPQLVTPAATELAPAERSGADDYLEGAFYRDLIRSSGKLMKGRVRILCHHNNLFLVEDRAMCRGWVTGADLGDREEAAQVPGAFSRLGLDVWKD